MPEHSELNDPGPAQDSELKEVQHFPGKGLRLDHERIYRERGTQTRETVSGEVLALTRQWQLY